MKGEKLHCIKKRSLVPNFLILGVQKSATTALFDALKDVQGLMPATKKEVHFFDSTENFHRGMEWYSSHFENSISALAFEATPSYIYYKVAAQRIRSSLEGTKFIVMLRDPVKRCLSAWNMFRRFNSDRATAQYIYDNYIAQCDVESRGRLKNLLFCKEFPSFEQCIYDDIESWSNSDPIEEPSFVRRGFYYEQIVNYLNYFTLEDFLFLEQEEYERDPVGSIRNICYFLNKEINVNLKPEAVRSNAGDYNGVSIKDISPSLAKLYDVYEQSNQRLYDLLGRKFSWEASWLPT